MAVKLFNEETKKFEICFAGQVVGIKNEYMWDGWYKQTAIVYEDGDFNEYVFADVQYGDPNGAEVDATEELIALWNKEVEQRERQKYAVVLWNIHNNRIDELKTLSLNMKQYKELKKTYSGNEYNTIYDLLKVKKFRNKFRENLSLQVRHWLDEKEHKYSKPLSYKQFACLNNTWFR